LPRLNEGFRNDLFECRFVVIPTSNQIPNIYISQFKGHQDVPLICQVCSNHFTKKRHHILENLKKGQRVTCSHSCAVNMKNSELGFGSATQPCENCGIEARRLLSDFKRSKKKHIFCSKSCAASYNNRHKKHGTRRSQLETHLELALRQRFPELTLVCNQINIIGYELDFYFPQLRLAIELNGIFHYEPIYGNDKLERIQYNDGQKALLCQQKGIEFCSINTSQSKYITTKVKGQYFDLIVNIITPLLGRLWSHAGDLNSDNLSSEDSSLH
jgi:very-short-patch-repair endonuclease